MAGRTVHQITFDPATFTEADLLWLPHHEQLSSAGRKRKADHLAGRIAAFHALNRQTLPGIGSNGEPLWPAGAYGSISHSGSLAVAICQEKGLVGIDCEAIIAENEARDIQDGVVDTHEAQRLPANRTPLPLVFPPREREPVQSAVPQGADVDGLRECARDGTYVRHPDFNPHLPSPALCTKSGIYPSLVPHRRTGYHPAL